MIMLPSKDPSEGIVVSFLFGRELLSAETLESCVVVATVETGYDPNPQAVVYSLSDLSGAPTVRQEIRGGADGTTYRLKATATLSSGRKLVRVGLLPVVAT